MTVSFTAAYITGWESPFVATLSYTCPECHGPADPFGDHVTPGGMWGNRDCIAHRNAIRDVLFSAAQSAALAPTKKAASLVPGSSTRPADILRLCTSSCT